MTITGIEKVIRNMQAADRKAGNRFSANLVKAGRYLQRASMKIVPVDTGVLKGSAYTRKFYSGWQTDVVVGYTAAYAIYVHENLDAAHGREYNIKYAKQIAAKWKGFHKRGENQQAKFLELPCRTERPTILRIVAGKR